MKGLLSAGAVGLEATDYDGVSANENGIGSCIMRCMLKIQSWLAVDGRESV